MTMDKKISPEMIRKRRRKLILQLSFAVVLIVAASVAIVHLLRSGISPDDIYTSVVDKGTIEITISATGKVVPLSEEVIVSPVSTKILEVFKKSGDSIQEGDPVVRLDLATINTEMERQHNELTMKRYQLEQKKTSAQSDLSDLAMQIEIDEMQIKHMEVALKNEVFLDSIGAGTANKIKQAELEFSVEKLKLAQLKLQYANRQKMAEADIKVLELDYSIATSSAVLKNKTMAEAQIRSPRTATLTWVNDQIGSKVMEGDQLAIVSDLAHFKVEAEVSDSYVNKILSGNQVIVKSANRELRGTVGNVVPSVRNGMINFTVLLENNRHELLRSGLKVDVYVVNAVRADILRIANRSYYSGTGEYDLWVVKNGEAVKRKVLLGESSYDHVEVKTGLEEGETVITSDMGRYSDENTLKIRN
jgi:HlyD family secretion protein